jgi:hypothetical protein
MTGPAYLLRPILLSLPILVCSMPFLSACPDEAASDAGNQDNDSGTIVPPDAGTAVPDAGLSDAGFSDAGFSDAGFSDAGFSDAGSDGGASLCNTCFDPGQGTTTGCYPVDSLAQCTTESVPRGIFLLVQWGADARVDPDLLDYAHISGATVRSYWKDLETSSGVYDWSKIDDHFAWAMERGKGVRLAVGTGAYAPAWLIGTAGSTACTETGSQSESGMGVKTFCAPVPNGEYSEELRNFPVPWDPVLHTQWRSFLTALVAHLEEQTEPSAAAPISALRWIAVTGPGGHNGEVSHPEVDWITLALPHPQTNTLVASSTELLSALTFTWNRAMDDFDEFFGTRQVHYTLSFVLKSFPIGAGNAGDDELFKAALVDYGVALPSAPYFGLQSNGLDDRYLWATTPSADWPNTKAHWALLRNHDTGAETFTGMQTRGMQRLYDDGETTPCERRVVWEGLVNNVQCLQVDVVEVYAADVTSPRDDSCDGGVRGELERLHTWLTE